LVSLASSGVGTSDSNSKNMCVAVRFIEEGLCVFNNWCSAEHVFVYGRCEQLEQEIFACFVEN
jgi:hypothetical protein